MTEHPDIAQRLEDHVNNRGGPAKDADGNYIGTVWPMMLEAAAEIRRLREELQRIRDDAEDKRFQ